MEEPGRSVTLGLDTHEDEHVAVALDALGRRLRSAAFPATKAGYRRLLRWGEALGGGSVASVGVEGTGSYGAGLARLLLSEGVRVFEVDRPNRRHGRAEQRRHRPRNLGGGPAA